MVLKTFLFILVTLLTVQVWFIWILYQWFKPRYCPQCQSEMIPEADCWRCPHCHTIKGRKITHLN